MTSRHCLICQSPLCAKHNGEIKETMDSVMAIINFIWRIYLKGFRWLKKAGKFLELSNRGTCEEILFKESSNFFLLIFVQGGCSTSNPEEIWPANFRRDVWLYWLIETTILPPGLIDDASPVKWWDLWRTVSVWAGRRLAQWVEPVPYVGATVLTAIESWIGWPFTACDYPSVCLLISCLETILLNKGKKCPQNIQKIRNGTHWYSVVRWLVTVVAAGRFPKILEPCSQVREISTLAIFWYLAQHALVSRHSHTWMPLKLTIAYPSLTSISNTACALPSWDSKCWQTTCKVTCLSSKQWRLIFEQCVAITMLFTSYYVLNVFLMCYSSTGLTIEGGVWYNFNIDIRKNI